MDSERAETLTSVCLWEPWLQRASGRAQEMG